VYALDASPAYKAKLYNTASASALLSRDYASNLFTPPWSPVDTDPGTMKVDVDGPANVGVKFFLSL
jgi:hypothetical protein